MKSFIDFQKEEVELDEATVKTQKYSWGTMKTVHHGSDFSIPLHPEHHQEIAKLKDQQEHKFKDESGHHWTAKRSGDDVHFKSANGGNSTTVKHSTMSEEVEPVNESHFDVGDSVVCKYSGTKGKVVKVDPKEEGKYYTVKHSDGEMVKYSPDELKLENYSMEEVDQIEESELDELSKDTLASYEKKSRFAAHKHAHASKMRNLIGDPVASVLHKQIADKRHAGWKVAVRKLNPVKEEIEQIEESDIPFEGPYKQSKGTVTDKSGAKHTPLSNVRSLARNAIEKMKQKIRMAHLSPEVKAAKLARTEELVGGQHKLDIDKDGKIEKSDLAMIRAKKLKEDVTTPAQKLKAALDRHTEHAVAANKAGDHDAVKVHQGYANKIKTQLGKLAKNEEVEIDEEQIEERNKQNAIMRKTMDASRGAKFKARNDTTTPDAEPQHKTAQAHNKAIGRAIRQMSNEEVEIDEASMTDATMAKREAIVKGMKNSFKDFTTKYGDRAKEVMYATATKMAVEEEVEEELEEDMEEGVTTRSGAITIHKGTYGTSYQGDDDEDDTPEEKDPTMKRGRGRPAGSKSGAKPKGSSSGKSYGGIAIHSLRLPNNNK